MHSNFYILTPILLFVTITISLGDSCDSLLADGDRFYTTFNNVKALSIYQIASQQCPDSYEPFRKKVRAYNDVGEDALLNNTDVAEAYFNRAIQAADTLIKRYPDSSNGYFLKSAAAGNLALLKGGQQKVKLARLIESSIKKALELNPSYSPSYVILGAYYREVATTNRLLKTFARALYGKIPSGTLEDSRKNLLKALELEPNNLYAHLELARTYLAMKKKQKANTHLQKIMQLPITGHQDTLLKQQAGKLLKQTD